MYVQAARDDKQTEDDIEPLEYSKEFRRRLTAALRILPPLGIVEEVVHQGVMQEWKTKREETETGTTLIQAGLVSDLPSGPKRRDDATVA